MQAGSISVHYTPNADTLSDLHDAVLDIVAVINRPDRDALLIAEAGIKLDRALFPLLVLIERFGPIGVVDLSGRVGRDHSTVSRQVEKLRTLALVERVTHGSDGRVRALVATITGRDMARSIDAARERLMRRALTGWSDRDVAGFARSLRRYADALGDP